MKCLRLLFGNGAHLGWLVERNRGAYSCPKNPLGKKLQPEYRGPSASPLLGKNGYLKVGELKVRKVTLSARVLQILLHSFAAEAFCRINCGHGSKITL